MKEKLKKFGKSVTKGSFFAKYFAVFSSVIIVCLCVIGLLLLFFTVNYWRDTKLQMLEKNADNIALTTSESLSQAAVIGDYERATIIICNTLKQISDSLDADVFVCNNDGKVILCKHLLSPDLSVSESGECMYHKNYKLSKDILSNAELNGYASFSKLSDTYADIHAVAVAPIRVNGQNIGVVVATAPVKNELVSFSIKVLGMFLTASAFTLFIVFIAVYIMTDKLTKPLREMAEATQHYAKGDFSYRVHLMGNDELTRLITDFNSMAKALEALESSRRNFVANVSHEFKTPMTTIGGFINGILDGTIPEEKQSYYLGVVSGEVKRLSRLVTTMLNISKIETGNVELKYESFDLSDMVCGTFLGFEQVIEQRGITVSGLDKLEPMIISADADMINQVIYNLVDNAVKFTNDSGEITVSGHETPPDVFLSIKNTGVGIPPDELGKVFERFYKIDKSRSTDTRSVGLGLHIVRSIVELHGGEISVFSVQNSYTEFAVRLKTQKSD